MNELIDLGKLTSTEVTSLDILPTIFSFIVCVVMSFIVREFYIRRSFSLTGKMHIGSIIPILSAVVFLVIIVVKSSLALSLGLVGALSIVRFRTPIKEPEELVYLFLAIALGLGYAAGHVFVTTVLVMMILIMIYLWLSNRKVAKTSEYNLVINWKKSDLSFEVLTEKVAEVSQSLKLVRLDRGPAGSTSVMLIVPNDNANLDSIITSLQEFDSELSVTFFEAKTNW